MSLLDKLKKDYQFGFHWLPLNQVLWQKKIPFWEINFKKITKCIPAASLLKFPSILKNSMDYVTVTSEKMKFNIKDFFSKCNQIHTKLQIWSHIQKKSLMENFIFWAVYLISDNEHPFKISYAHFWITSRESKLRTFRWLILLRETLKSPQ